MGYNEVYEIRGPLDMTCLFELVQMVDRKDLREPPLVPQPPAGLQRLRRPVCRNRRPRRARCTIRTIRSGRCWTSSSQAARDPQVLAIKQTLYRTSGDSPIVRALAEAAENGKHVTALVELKARFDEANNITWARQLERAGVHVVFGFMEFKTHCKLAMVVRKEGKKVRRYVPPRAPATTTPPPALVYTDLGLFTADKVIADDVSALFNFLTGYSQKHEWQKLVVAPQRSQAAHDRADQRAGRAGPRRQAVADFRQAQFAGRSPDDRSPLPREPGRRADRPDDPRHLLPAAGPARASRENIRVRSIVDRFLEHSRILVFGEGHQGAGVSSAAPTGCRGISTAAWK